MKIEIIQSSETSCSSKIRKHQVSCDRPQEKGGNDEGPMGGEYFLMGLGGCFTSNLLAAIKNRNANISNVQLDVTAILQGKPSRISEINIAVSADYEDQKLFEKLLIIAERGCIIANTIKDSVKLSVTVNIP